MHELRATFIYLWVSHGFEHHIIKAQFTIYFEHAGFGIALPMLFSQTQIISDI